MLGHMSAIILREETIRVKLMIGIYLFLNSFFLNLNHKKTWHFDCCTMETWVLVFKKNSGSWCIQFLGLKGQYPEGQVLDSITVTLQRLHTNISWH